eukprot:GHVQ01041021.1.p1 GENE.GHVQ01041021.1~~GHVQ01041021.1.p1  ORF type:complete len:253 (-),score=21.16 GHVQ01041021.1:1122-1880(-)
MATHHVVGRVTDAVASTPAQGFRPNEIMTRHADISGPTLTGTSVKERIVGVSAICVIIAVWVSSGYLYKMLQHKTGPKYDKPFLIVFVSQSACMALLLLKEEIRDFRYFQQVDETTPTSGQRNESICCRFSFSWCLAGRGLPNVWMSYTVLGLLIVLFRCLWPISLRWTAVSLNTVLYDSHIFMVFLLSICLLKEKIRRCKVFSVMMGFGGVVLICIFADSATPPAAAVETTVGGVFLTLLSAGLYAIYTGT